MANIDVEEPLTSSTARLSISQIDMENENPRHQVAEFLKSNDNNDRRDSVVSITSLDEGKDFDTSLNDFKEKYSSVTGAVDEASVRNKRRRSSAQSFSSPSVLAVNERKTLRAHKKKLKKAIQPPNIELITEANSTKKNPASTKKLTLSHFRDLIIYLLNKEQPPNWVKITQPYEINKVVFCFIPGLLIDDFIKNPEVNKEAKIIDIKEIDGSEDFSFFRNNFKELLPTSAPGTKESIFLSLHAITNVPLTKKEKKDICDALQKSKLTIWDLLLTSEQLSQNNYPILLEEGWIETKDFEHSGSHTFALDCEFCQSANGKVLTRISIINFQNEVVLDTLVKPDEEITDYVTKYSGITEDKLKDVTTTLSDIHNEISKIISAEDVLIGHSLESDLNVMKIKHSRIIDTSLCYEHSRGPPLKPSLKWLADKYLKRDIQKGEVNGEGHSSIEDARACLDLVKLKIQEGKYFGLNLNEVTIFERLNKGKAAKKNQNQKDIRSLLIDYSPLRDWKYDSSILLNKVQVNNDDEIVKIFKKEVDQQDLVILKLREMEFNSGWSPIPKSYNGYMTDSSTDVVKSQLYKNLNKRLNEIMEAMTDNTAFIICSSLGDPREMIKLQNIKKSFQMLERQGKDLTNIPEEERWDFDKLSKLQVATNSARQAISFITLKQNKEPFN